MAKIKRPVVEKKASTPVQPPISEMSSDERYRRVCEIAYLIAESRGFVGGSCEDDWYEAERRVDRALKIQTE